MRKNWMTFGLIGLTLLGGCVTRNSVLKKELSKMLIEAEKNGEPCDAICDKVRMFIKQKLESL